VQNFILKKKTAGEKYKQYKWNVLGMRKDTHQKDRTWNTPIRKERNISKLNKRIKNKELNWSHDVVGMEPERIPKQLLD
jgi:hypothetical protein